MVTPLEGYQLQFQLQQVRAHTTASSTTQSTSRYLRMFTAITHFAFPIVARSNISGVLAHELVSIPTNGSASRSYPSLSISSSAIIALLRYVVQDARIRRHMVAKQTLLKHSMDSESKILHQLTDTGTDHVVKLYKSYYSDVETGTSNDVDPYPLDDYGNADESERMGRFFLEYFEDGDLENYVE